MQTGRLTQLCLTMLAVAVFFEAPIYAQTQNAEAIKWFNKGIREKDPEAKINFYEQALAQDPNFVEVLYNMGLVYKQLKDFKKAESYLQSAHNTKKQGQAKKIESRILYHLALTQKQLGKHTESEKSLLAARKSAKNRGLKSQIVFELGRVYYEQGRFEQALATLRQGQEKFKDNSSFFQNLIKIVQLEQQVNKLERAIQNAIDTQDYIQAQALVQQLKTIKPGHANLEDKTALIDSLIDSKARKNYLEDMLLLALKHTKEGNLESAISTYEILLQNDPANAGIQQTLANLKREFEQQQSAESLKNEYAAGIKAMADNNWTRSIIAFEKVIEINPDHEDARRKLEEANRRLESESTETIVRQYYFDGIAAMNRKDLRAALASFEKVYGLMPNYKDTKEMIDQLRSSQVHAGRASTMMSDEYFKSLYDQAIASMAEEDWMQAVLTMEKLRLLAPNDHNLLNLLIQAKEKLEMADKMPVASATNNSFNMMFYIGGAIVAVLILPLFGFIIFSPINRARLYYLRGDYAKAAQIYERLLAKHPERLKYYATLANIYLILGRMDERALRVFKMIIDLNIAHHIQPQVSSVLSQKYLSDGHHEEEAIDILEKAIKIEHEIHESSRKKI